MQRNPIPERDDWFITDRKPTICPRCKKKEVRPSMFGMPTAEAALLVGSHSYSVIIIPNLLRCMDLLQIH